MNTLIQTRWFPIALLCGSNIFMTFAWYGHLKFGSSLFSVEPQYWGNRSFPATK
jgi:hypothetical protein